MTSAQAKHATINPPVGWTSDVVQTLGERILLGGPYFNLGPRPQILAADLPRLGPGMFVGDAIKNVRFITDLLTPSPRWHVVSIRGDKSPHETTPLGYGGSPFIDDYRYLACLSEGDPAVDGLIMSFPLLRKIERMGQTDQPLVYQGRQPLLQVAGQPAVIRWHRDQPHDLLVATTDGRIVRHPRLPGPTPAWDTQGQAVSAETGPLIFEGQAMISVVDWHGQGRNDLLVGTATGDILLYPDTGDSMQVRLGRPVHLVSPDGPITLARGASPALLVTDSARHLIAADGLGVVHAWEIKPVSCIETTGLPPGWSHAGEGVTRSKDRSQPTVLPPPQADLVLNLPVTGWHEVHLLFESPQKDMPQPMVEARLSAQADFVCISRGEASAQGVAAVHLITANLSDTSLHLRQLIGDFYYTGGWPAGLQGVRLIPAKPSASAATKQAQRPVAAILDTVMWFKYIRCQSPAEMDALMGYHQQAGFNRIYYKLGGASWEYPSAVPETRGAVPNLPYFDEQDKAYCHRLNDLLENVNRVQLAIDACKHRGMAFFGWMRIQNHGEHLAPHAKYTCDQFYLNHPEFLELDAHGQVLPGKLCLGYPEVRAYLASIAKEAVTMGAQGILIDTLRQLPKVMYGKPVADAFFQKHGMVMNTLPPFDPRLVDMQVSVMTDLLRDIRTAIHEVNPKAQLHVRVGSASRLMGCDPGLWAKQGLIDAVIIERRALEAGQPDVKGMGQALEGTDCSLIASFARTTWGQDRKPMLPQRIRTEVNTWLKDGAQGIAFYETAMAIPHPQFCRAIREINDPDVRYSTVTPP